MYGYEEKRPRGRPKKYDSRHETFKVRLDMNEVKELEYLSYITGKSKSDIVRRALQAYYNTTTRRY